MPVLHRMGAPETPQQPASMDTALSSPGDTSIFVFPQPPPPSTPRKERAPGVTYVTKVHAYFHSVKPPRARTPIPNQTQATISHEDKRPSPSAGTSYWELSPGKILTPLNDIKAPPLEPPLLSAPQEPKFAPTEESIRPPSPKPSTSSSKSTTNGSDTEIPGSKRAPELPKQDDNILKPSNPSAPWRQKRPGRARPAQADGMQPIFRDTKEERVIQPHLTPNLPTTSPLPIAEPSVKAARGPGSSAGGWHRLRKHLMVQPEAPNFPKPNLDELGQEEESKEKDSPLASPSQDCMLLKSKATRMWDAILYQMATNKERKQQAEEKKLQKAENCFLPRRLPILLHKPRFDARKLKELAAKPMTKITTVFEVGRFKPKPPEEQSTSFNRTASGWSNN